MNAPLAAVLLNAALVTAALAGLRLNESTGRARVPWVTLGALLVVGIPSVLQLTLFPGLLEDLGRDRAAIAGGQVWRLVTALTVQDGGVSGTVSNLVYLAVVGAIAESWWGPRRWVVVAAGSGVAAEFWGLLVQPVGAGNSVAVFGLATSLAVAALVPGTSTPLPDARPRLLAAASLICSAALLVTGDLHGGAALAGAVLGGRLAAQARRVTSTETNSSEPDGPA